jgi:glycyl-tRNA synthetase
MNFQDVITKLNQFWSDQGCVIWQPHNVQVGAGTANPATILRVLGPEPWNVAYPEPSVRPADGRYGENPNRWQEYYQYQVILKPDPINHIELYLQSLEAIGIAWRKHDIRFVEDNWQSPPLGAWGLGWEVWLDGLEITQYTYFQQAGGMDLDPVCVEITYGLERIVMYLQGVKSIPEIHWLGDITYGDIHLADEIDYCRYNFDVAEVERLRQMYDLNEAESKLAVAKRLVLPAHDYLLKCSHIFNVLDARSAIGVTQRANYFARMRDLARQIAHTYIQQREQLKMPLARRQSAHIKRPIPTRRNSTGSVSTTADLVFEIGAEEMPSGDLASAIDQLRRLAPGKLKENRLKCGQIRIGGTPRRLVLCIEALASVQSQEERLIKGPAADIAFDANGRPTSAAQGFARSHGATIDDLIVTDFDGKRYAAVKRVDRGRPASEILSKVLPEIVAELKFPLSMRWNETGVAFSRPIRWLLAVHGDALIDIEYAGVPSDRYTYGLRPEGSPEIVVNHADEYERLMTEQRIIIDPDHRRQVIWGQVTALTARAGGVVVPEPSLLDEVTHLVENPTPVLGDFDAAYLPLPEEVLIAVMRKHQRCFPVRESIDGPLMACFITVANGDRFDEELVRHGNEAVIHARFADASFFYNNDLSRPLADFLPRLAGLTFQHDLGSYLDKTKRLGRLVPILANQMGISDGVDFAQRAAALCKADLVTSMVVEFTSLQGHMGRIYALKNGEDPGVAEAILEHHLPRSADDRLPASLPGILVGLADRLDSLIGLFAVGLGPTGTTDPYGLRRVALSIVQMLAEKGISLSLHSAVEEAAKLAPVPVQEGVVFEVKTFIRRRLHGWLLERDFRPDLVEAVLAEQADNPAQAYTTLKGLTLWARRPEFEKLLEAYTRTTRIAGTIVEALPLAPELLTEPTSRRLCEAYLTVCERLKANMEVEALLASMLTLVEPIHAFFDEILVMHEDQGLREARLGLLQHIAQLPDGVVDLSKIKAA